MKMDFMVLKKNLQDNFREMTKEVKQLFEVEIDKEEMWNLYLDSFPEGTNEMFRERREYDCSCCRQFIKNIGNVVVIKDNQVTTIWDFNAGHESFQVVLDALSNYIKTKAVSNIYVSKEAKIGVNSNFELLGNGEVVGWEHFYLELQKKFVCQSHKSEGDIKGSFRDVRNVFKRSLDEIEEDAVKTVLELIYSNTLYKGEEWKHQLIDFVNYKTKYMELSNEDKENYAWEQSVEVGSVIGKIRNHSIGTLLINISEGMELDLAVRKYENIVAPENYKRSKPIFTKQMLEKAQKTIQKLGYENSLQRIYATLDDITINNILFSNKDSAKRIGNKDIFEEMLDEVAVTPKQFSKVEEIKIDDFIKNVLPTTNEIEVLLENKHNTNLMSLIAPQNEDSKTMFKWNNNFSWAYAGNIADSSMKKEVKNAGGDIEGELRFSIQWNDGNDHNPNDFDAHCIEPNGNKIYYGKSRNARTTGKLDVDIQHPQNGSVAVENITWTNRSKMRVGRYVFLVHNYANRGGRNGFKAEIEFDGQIYSFEYNKELKQNEEVLVVEVYLDENGVFTIKELIPSETSSKNLWGLKTNQFVPVSVIMFSPNYWDEQKGIGNRHCFFMLKDCINPEQPNGFYNEFLNQELHEHRRVMEALSSKMRVEESGEQLSGLGFSSTQRNEVVVKVKGSVERTLKVKF